MEEFTKEWLALNAALQKKKNALRKALKGKGVLQKSGKNDFDRYTYFSEAQYKELFTGLFADAGLEMKFSEVDYIPFDGSEKQANGRMTRLEFRLIDCDTGFYESSVITGEGIDKGDKAGYKAYTGALKYWLADTFMVATGDDPEKDSPAEKMNPPKTERGASEKQLAILKRYYTGENLERLLATNNIKEIEQLPMEKASALIKAIMANRNGGTNG